MPNLTADLLYTPQRQIDTLFIGGGTPSLFSAEAIARLLTTIGERVPLAPDLEITLEANPGTVEQQRFIGYQAAGVNRLSIGIQSFNANSLRQLGRIHDPKAATTAVQLAQDLPDTRVNLDLTHGLPQKTLEQALADLQQAVDLAPTHLSWYQLTLEPTLRRLSRDWLWSTWENQLSGWPHLAHRENPPSSWLPAGQPSPTAL